jgi:hypothetical protein
LPGDEIVLVYQRAGVERAKAGVDAALRRGAQREVLKWVRQGRPSVANGRGPHGLYFRFARNSSTIDPKCGFASYHPEFLFHSITQADKTLLPRSTAQVQCEVDISRGVRSYTSRASCTCSMFASAQPQMPSTRPHKDRPRLVSEYSTLGGTLA